MDEEQQAAVTVIVRVRPLLPAERGEVKTCTVRGAMLIVDEPDSPAAREPVGQELVTVAGLSSPPLASYTFSFDHIFAEHSTQADVYERTARPAVRAVLEGFNATVIAYGMTGAGKTHTMEGLHGDRDHRGVTPRAVEDVFEYVRACQSPANRFLVRLSYLQIYNESISDLLKASAPGVPGAGDRAALNVREDRRRGLFVDGLSEWAVRSTAEVRRLLARGQAVRATGSTRANELSSRSHAVVLLSVEQTESTAEANGCADMDTASAPRRVRVGKLNLVDLAGSERLSASGASGARLEESKKINTSLSALGNVVAALSERARGRSHIPYRDSKLTRLLEDSLGGNCKTTLIALVSPAARAFGESLSTLKFATRAKKVRNTPKVNAGEEGLEAAEWRALARQYESQISALKAELAERASSSPVPGAAGADPERLKELEHLEHLRQSAEEDRSAAVRALEVRSSEYLSEKAGKRALEARVAMLQGQLLQAVGGASADGAGGGGGAGGSSARSGGALSVLELEEHYGARLEELERDRAAVDEDKAQLTRYKELLVKQRDLMLALTKRLNERDGEVLTLQADLDEADTRSTALEAQLDARSAQLAAIRRVAIDHGVPGHSLDAVLEHAPGSAPDSVGDLFPSCAGGDGRGGGGIERQGTGAKCDAEAAATIASEDPLATGARLPTSAVASASAALATSPPGDKMSLSGAEVLELRALIRDGEARRAELEAELEEVTEALAATEQSVARRVRELVDQEVADVAADAVAVVNEVKQARLDAEEAMAARDEAAAARAAAQDARWRMEVRLREVEGQVAEVVEETHAQLQRLLPEVALGLAAESGGRAACAAAPGAGEDTVVDVRLRALRMTCMRLVDVAASRVPLGSTTGQPNGDWPPEATDPVLVQRLQQRCAAHVKERNALTSILENKVKALVDELASALCEGEPAVEPAAINTAGNQVRVLQRLVNASVNALRHPADADGTSSRTVSDG